ncbi:MAG TPA: beta-propeller fold lactonase family protein [Solirubrobacteraceae bacterium]|nr:beta-propeller fold lactonase family protein [Solirubrobacteraceae bacterium]
MALAAGLAGLAALVVTALGLVAPTRAGATPPIGSLSQLAEPFNCVGEEGFHQPEIGCGTILPKEAINAAYEAQVSPDGKNVYSVAVNGALVEYARNQADGSLTEIGCITAKAESCSPTNATTEAIAMSNPAAIAISPNGANAYAVTQGTNSLVEFSRNSETGLLTEIGCISRENTECAVHNAGGLNSPYGIVVSPDGKNVYTAAYSDEAIAEFSRNTETGVLKQLTGANNCITSGSTGLTGCNTEKALGLERAIGVVVSPDGKNVYVAAGATNGEGAIVAFERDTAEEGALKQLSGAEGCISTFNTKCAPGVAIKGPESLVISPDGRNVYANSSENNAVLEFWREPSGALAQLASPNACAMNAPAEAGCSQVKGLERALGVAISPGGESVYVSSAFEDDEAAFDRNAETGALTPLESPYECLGKAPFTTCDTTGIKGIAGARRVTVSPDAKNVYVAGQNDHDVVEFQRQVPAVEPPPGKEPEPAVKPATTPLVSPLVSPPPPRVPPPVLARTGNVAPVSGVVMVKLPGTSKFVPLSTLEQIPFGSIIEATHGTVSVTTAEPGGKTQTGQFFQGEFILRQGPNGLVIAELTGGNFTVCPTARERAHKAELGGPAAARISALDGSSATRAATPGARRALAATLPGAPAARAAASGSHVVRKLWANAHGKFSTKGNYAAGAVQGTEWLTEDLCDGTYIKVTRDKVAVTNLVNHRKVEVKVGRHYLAKAP